MLEVLSTSLKRRVRCGVTLLLGTGCGFTLLLGTGLLGSAWWTGIGILREPVSTLMLRAGELHGLAPLPTCPSWVVCPWCVCPACQGGGKCFSCTVGDPCKLLLPAEAARVLSGTPALPRLVNCCPNSGGGWVTCPSTGCTSDAKKS